MGVIAHYQNGTWHVTNVPREAEIWWLALIRYIILFGMIAGFIVLLWLLRLTATSEGSSLLHTPHATVALLFMEVGIVGTFTVIAEPLLSPEFNIGLLLWGDLLAFVGLIIAYVAVWRLERKHKRTPIPVTTDSFSTP